MYFIIFLNLCFNILLYYIYYYILCNRYRRLRVTGAKVSTFKNSQLVYCPECFCQPTVYQRSSLLSLLTLNADILHYAKIAKQYATHRTEKTIISECYSTKGSNTFGIDGSTRSIIR